MHIVTLSNLGGAQSVVINMANELCHNHQVIVVAGEGDGKLWELLDISIKVEKIDTLKRALSPISDLKTVYSFIRLYKKYNPDIIHLHSSKAGFLGRLVFPRKKIIYTVHGFDSIRIAHRIFLPIERLFQNKCKAIVPVSKYDELNLREEKITHNIHLVYNGIEKPSELSDINFSFVDKYLYKVLCIARLSPPKDCDLFLKVAAKLPHYAFIWIGNQQEFIKRHPSNVFFMGSIPNAGAYNEYIDLFILPSNYEGLPMTIIEAMSFGKPVVASAVGGISEIVVNDVNGYTVENIVEAFAEKIEYILENQDVYNRFSKNALKRYQEDLMVDKMVEGYLKIYNA